MWIVVIEGLLLICLCPFLIEDILEVQHNCIIQETSYSNITPKFKQDEPTLILLISVLMLFQELRTKLLNRAFAIVPWAIDRYAVYVRFKS